MTYALWIPALILHTAAMMWLSVRIMEAQSIAALAGVQALCLFSLWGAVSYFSDNLLLDGVIFDVVLFIASSLFIALFSGRFATIGAYHFVGFTTMMIGLLIFKYAEGRV